MTSLLVEFSAGSMVEAFGLVGAVHLNGKRGVLTGARQGERLGVAFPPPHGVKALLPHNLLAVRADASEGAPDFSVEAKQPAMRIETRLTTVESKLGDDRSVDSAHGDDSVEVQVTWLSGELAFGPELVARSLSVAQLLDKVDVGTQKKLMFKGVVLDAASTLADLPDTTALIVVKLNVPEGNFVSRLPEEFAQRRLELEIFPDGRAKGEARVVSDCAGLTGFFSTEGHFRLVGEGKLAISLTNAGGALRSFHGLWDASAKEILIIGYSFEYGFSNRQALPPMDLCLRPESTYDWNSMTGMPMDLCLRPEYL